MRGAEGGGRTFERVAITCFLAVSSVAAQAVPATIRNTDVSAATLAQTVCTPGYTRSVRPSTVFTNGIKKRLMRQQGLDFDTQKGEFELDHIVPLALGGHPRNLENFALQRWEGHGGAKRKDRLEVKLQCLVCSGAVPLEVSQDAIWLDWQIAYSTYGRMACKRSRSLPSTEYGDQP
jgi:hypothetical protein